MKRSFIFRRRILALLSALLIVSLTVAANPGVKDVDAKILTHFTTNYANAKSVTWEVSKRYSKAIFTENNKRTEVFYSPKNKLMGTAVYVTLKELPYGSADIIENSYAKYRATTALQYTNVQNEVNYFVQMENDKSKIVLQIDPQGEVECIKSERK